MNNHKLKIEEEFNKAIGESKKMLGSMSALDLMSDAGEFHRQLVSLVDSLHLPACIIIGILTSEAQRLNNESTDLKYLAAFELFKKYVEENYMKKE